MKSTPFVLLVVGSLTCATKAPALVQPDPVTITFNHQRGDLAGRGPIEENGYLYEAPAGTSWNINPPPEGGDHVLFNFWGIVPSVGEFITFTKQDGGDFRLLSLDIMGRLDNWRNDVVIMRGLLNGDEVASQILQSSNIVWSTVTPAPGFESPIDTLRLELAEHHGAALLFDDIALDPVPEPATFTLLGLGSLALVIFRRRS